MNGRADQGQPERKPSAGKPGAEVAARDKVVTGARLPAPRGAALDYALASLATSIVVSCRVSNNFRVLFWL